MAMILKFLEYISNIKIKKSGPPSGSLHEKKCILLSVLRGQILILKRNRQFHIMEGNFCNVMLCYVVFFFSIQIDDPVYTIQSISWSISPSHRL